MKTILNSTMKHRGFGFACSLVFVFLFSSITFLSAGEIIKIASIKVSKNYPASFVLDLERNDIVTVKYGKNGGKADLSQLLVQVIDLNQQDEEVIGSFTRSGRDFLAKFDGKYRIDFIYQGKGSGLFKQRNLDLNIEVDLDGYEGLDEGEAREILRSTNCVIEETEANAMRINYYLYEGDVLDITSSDSKASFVKLYISQLAKTFSVSQAPKIVIPSDGTYSLKFYLEADEGDGSLFNWKELLSKGDFLFRDLSIYRTRAADPEAFNSVTSPSVPDVGSSSGGESGTGIIPVEVEENDNDITYALEQMLQDGNKNSAEMNAAFMEAMAAMQETLNKKNIIRTVTSIPDELSMRLEPEFNFSNDNGNRKCEALRLQPTNFNFWFYWVGVGEGAEKAFELHNEEITKTFKESLGEAKAKYIYAKFGGNTGTKRNPSFPNEKTYPQYLGEDAEYAIVDYRNMQKFLAGQRYRKLNQSSKRSAYVTSDDGIASKPSLDEEVFFCACNNNKATPVNLFFTFFTIQIDEEEF